jgi:hypothetical protein
MVSILKGYVRRGLKFRPNHLFTIRRNNRNVYLQIPRRGNSGLIVAKMLETKAMGWVQNSCVLSQYICIQLSRASFSDQVAQKAWAGFFAIHKNRF